MNKHQFPITSIGIINIKINEQSFYYKNYVHVINIIKSYDNFIDIFKSIHNKNNINYKNNFNNYYKNATYNYILNDLKNNLYFLFVRRKNSIEYSEFIKGKYNVDDKNSYLKLIKFMTPDEIDTLKNNDFQIIWDEFWYNKNENDIDKNKLLELYKYEYLNSFNKFIQINKDIFDKSISQYNYPEWGFPKGRKNK